MRLYRTFVLTAMIGLLAGALALIVSMAATGSMQRAPATKAKVGGEATWKTPGESLSESSAQSVCSPVSRATADCAGFSVAVSGDTAVVAAPGTKHKTGEVVIWIFVHVRIGVHPAGSVWVRETSLPDPRNISDDEYAWATAIVSTKSATYIAIGGNDNNGERDLVYIYEGSGKTWHLQATIADPGISFADMFGDSLTMSANILVIGASCLDYDSGAAYIYQRSGSRWILRADMKDPLDREGDFYGQSVALSGSSVIVGAIGDAYVYTGTPAHHWPLTATLRNPDAPQDDYGNSVAMSGDTAVIGAPGGAPGSGAVMPGAVYLYKKTGARWSLTGNLTAPAGTKGDEFGYSVAMTAANILVGMPQYGAEPDCGTAFAYKPSGSKWVLLHRLNDPSCAAGASFGYSVELYGGAAVVGAPGVNNYQGAAYELPIS